MILKGSHEAHQTVRGVHGTKQVKSPLQVSVSSIFVLPSLTLLLYEGRKSILPFKQKSLIYGKKKKQENRKIDR